MSEYWVSKKKYFCKYCDIYIADDAPSRQQHENGLRHKGNVERFIRGIYKAGEKQKKDSEEEKREMRRVEQAANAAFAQDVGAGRAKASSAAPIASTSAPPKPAPKPSNPFANYSTAASLGYSDPDADRIAAEFQLRRSQGVAGEWEILAPPQPPVGPDPSAPKLEEDPAEPILKREAEAPPDDEDARAFKLRKKTLQTGLGEIYDPGLIPIKLKKKEEPQELLPSASTPAKLEPEEPNLPKWTKIQLKRPGESSQNAASLPAQSTDESAPTQNGSPSTTKWAKPQWGAPLPDIPPEDRRTIFLAESEAKSEAPPPAQPDGDVKPDIKAEGESPVPPESGASSGSLFKKRRAPTGAGKGRRPV